jgi:diguanylate cyclase (GGDEF)-like protein
MSVSAVPGADRLRCDRVLPTSDHPQNFMTSDQSEALERQLARHARLHGAVARLGQVALREQEPASLTDEIVRTVADTLDVQLCGVLRLCEDGETLEIVANVGHTSDLRSIMPAGTGTHAGYALSRREAVVSQDLRSETRFETRHLLGRGMRSGINAVIEGPEEPYGVLSAHTTRRRDFGEDDVNFLVAVANILSAAVERHRREALTRHQALHDPLTGLPNRTLALDRLDLALARRRREDIGVAMLMLDLDRFKIINDSLGHAVGDEVLVALGTRLRETLRPSDTVARLGGDEFVVVCELPDDIHRVVELAERIGCAVSKPLTLESGEHVLTASIGIAIAELPSDTSASLLRDADVAMYRAKHRGPGRYELFDSSLRSQVLARLNTETELRQALERDELCVDYQPIIELATGRPVATEALVRWEHPRHGRVPPLDFIPIAEETGLIVALGREVLRRACEQGARWQRQFGCRLQTFVNVSGSQIANPRFPAEVAGVCAQSGLVPGTLRLEVTESVLIERTGESTAVLGRLHADGVQLVLDDFGTGYSSLSYLRNFPLDGVKVDRAFTDGLGGSERDAAIMRAIVEMCGALGLSVVAEGVESAAQLEQLEKLGCHHVQGYLLCRPMPAEELTGFLAGRLAQFATDHPSVPGSARSSQLV